VFIGIYSIYNCVLAPKKYIMLHATLLLRVTTKSEEITRGCGRDGEEKKKMGNN